jgi:phosphoglycerate dehydrogenase-like enzyme
MARRLYLAASDSEDGIEAREEAPGVLPAGWELATDPVGATVIVSIDLPVDADTIKRAGPDLRAVCTIGPEIDEVATAEAGARVVQLLNSSDLSRLCVAEYSVGLMLLLKHNSLAVARTPSMSWLPDRATPSLTDQHNYVYNWPGIQGSGFLRGNVVGIVGAGGLIGAQTARLLTPFGVRLIYTQRTRLPEERERELGVEWREFDDFVRESDVITLCHRLQEGPGGNEGQFGAREFAMMKPDAIFINTARGRTVDEDALVEALRTKQIAGAGLDVFHYEPLPKDHPLLALAGDNVVISPHLAAGTENEYWRYTMRCAIEACA